MKVMHMRTIAIIAAALCAAWLGGSLIATSVASAATGGPTVTLTSTAPTSTSATAIPITATFSAPVSGFNASDITVTNGTVSNFATSTPNTVYTFDVNPTASGAVTIDIPADVVQSAPTGNQGSNTLTFTYATSTGPSITNIAVSSITGTGATISWNTGTTSTSTVEYGTTTSYGSTTAATALGTSHSVTLSNLMPSTTYHFRVDAQDTSGNTSMSNDYTFMTLASSTATTTPVITNLTVGSTSTSSAVVSWMTDVPATTQVNYGTSTSYGSSSMLDNSLTTSHSVTLPNLNEATQYFIQAASGNSFGTTTATTTFTTASTASTTPLAIIGTQAVKTSAFADNTFADGWEWVITFTVPTNETQFAMRFSDFTSSSSSSTIPANGNIRIFSPQSSTATSSDSAITMTGNDYATSTTLVGDADPNTPGRQVQVDVQVKIPFGTPNGAYTTVFQAQSSTP